MSVTRQKQAAWDKVGIQFNTSFAMKRTVKQLQKCWANMKSRAKTNIASDRLQRRLTGGGTASPLLWEEHDGQVAGIIAEQVLPPTSELDEDNGECTP